MQMQMSGGQLLDAGLTASTPYAAPNGNNGNRIRPPLLRFPFSASQKFYSIKKTLDKQDFRAIISMFCLSRRYSSVGRAADL